MKMTTRIKNFIKDPASFSSRKIKNLCNDEELDKDFIFKYQDYLNWSIILKKYKFTFDELDLIIPLARKRRLYWELITFQTFREDQLDFFIREGVYNGFTIFEYQKVSEEFIERHIEVRYWDAILEHQKLSEKFLRKHVVDFSATRYNGEVCWSLISTYQTLSDDFIRDFNRKLDWRKLSHFQNLSESILKEFADKVWWCEVDYNRLSEDFIGEMENKVDWQTLSRKKKNITDEFIDKWANKLFWFDLCYFNKVSSHLLEKYVDKLNFNWDVLCEYQNLSENFMREYVDKMNWYKIVREHILSEDFVREMFDIMGREVTWIFKTVKLKGNNYRDEFKEEMRERYRAKIEKRFNR